MIFARKIFRSFKTKRDLFFFILYIIADERSPRKHLIDPLVFIILFSPITMWNLWFFAALVVQVGAQVIAPNPDVPEGYQVGFATVCLLFSLSLSLSLSTPTDFLPSKTTNPMASKASAQPPARSPSPSPAPQAPRPSPQASTPPRPRPRSVAPRTIAPRAGPATVLSRAGVPIVRLIRMIRVVGMYSHSLLWG